MFTWGWKLRVLFWNVNNIFENIQTPKSSFAKPETWEVFFPHLPHPIGMETYWVDFVQFSWIFLLLSQLHCSSPHPASIISHLIGFHLLLSSLASASLWSLSAIWNLRSRWFICVLYFESTDISPWLQLYSSPFHYEHQSQGNHYRI